MAGDMFIKIDGIKGESKDDKHKDEIDIMSWSWGANQTANAHQGSGSGAGKASIGDVMFTKKIDKSSPNLLKYLAQGSHIKEATLVCRKAGGKALEFVKLKVEGAFIASYTVSGSGDDIMESVVLNFGKFKYEYIPQKTDGSGDASIPVSMDIVVGTVT